ncbi:proteasome assembly chaperone 4-like [Bolinopsis microptera]|uniref:proteasome assembly chaperone 4-like n=1 Tax=Bolinopsis microptera TaxID=2820187 RepID=UPI0030792865
MSTHAFTAMGVYFHVIKMKQSFVLWIGHDEPKIDSLATAISLPSRPAACSKLMGSADWTTTFAQKLAVKTKHQVFIMADELEPDEVPLSEKVVFQKLRTDPHIFLTEPEVPS